MYKLSLFSSKNKQSADDESQIESFNKAVDTAMRTKKVALSPELLAIYAKVLKVGLKGLDFEEYAKLDEDNSEPTKNIKRSFNKLFVNETNRRSRQSFHVGREESDNSSEAQP